VNCLIFFGCLIYILKTWDWVKSERELQETEGAFDDNRDNYSKAATNANVLLGQSFNINKDISMAESMIHNS